MIVIVACTLCIRAQRRAARPTYTSPCVLQLAMRGHTHVTRAIAPYFCSPSLSLSDKLVGACVSARLFLVSGSLVQYVECERASEPERETRRFQSVLAYICPYPRSERHDFSLRAVLVLFQPHQIYEACRRAASYIGLHHRLSFPANKKFQSSARDTYI